MDRIAGIALLMSVAWSTFTACDGSEGAPSEEAARQDSAGIQIVVGPAGDLPLEWTVNEVLRLGEVDSGPAAFSPLRPGDVAVLDGERIHVLDRMNHRVQLFDSAGRHLLTVGRGGGGPGELRTPASLAVKPTGEILVLDYAKRGLLRFAPTGEPKGTWELELPYWGHATAWLGGGALLTIAEGYRTDDPYVTERLIYLRPGANGHTEIAAIERANPEHVQYPGCVGIKLDPIFASELRWSASPAGIVVNSVPDYEIRRYGPEGELRSIYRRPVPARPATADLALAEIGRSITIRTPGGECSIRPHDLLEGRGFAEWVPTVGRLALSPEGRVWVRRYALRGETPRTDVFEPDGSYAGTLPEEFPFPVAFLSEDRIVALERDDLHVDYVVVYQLR